MKSLDEKFDILEKKIKEPGFRQNRGVSNEVKYFIFDYPAADELKVRSRINYIQNKNDASSDDYTIQVFDLYEIMLDILKSKGRLEKCFELEKSKGFDKLCHGISNLLKVNSTDGLIIRYIDEHLLENAIVFITGVGKCYPIIRSHTILNNLHMVIDYVPVVLFYPGKYNGQELMLFDGEIKDDNYYRAFRIDE